MAELVEETTEQKTPEKDTIGLNDIYDLLMHVNTTMEFNLHNFSGEMEKMRENFDRRIKAVETLAESVDRIRTEMKLKKENCVRHSITLKHIESRVKAMELKLGI